MYLPKNKPPSGHVQLENMLASDTDLRVYRGVAVYLVDEDEAPCRRLLKSPIPQCHAGVTKCTNFHEVSGILKRPRYPGMRSL